MKYRRAIFEISKMILADAIYSIQNNKPISDKQKVFIKQAIGDLIIETIGTGNDILLGSMILLTENEEKKLDASKIDIRDILKFPFPPPDVSTKKLPEVKLPEVQSIKVDQPSNTPLLAAAPGAGGKRKMKGGEGLLITICIAALVGMKTFFPLASAPNITAQFNQLETSVNEQLNASCPADLDLYFDGTFLQGGKCAVSNAIWGTTEDCERLNNNRHELEVQRGNCANAKDAQAERIRNLSRKRSDQIKNLPKETQEAVEKTQERIMNTIQNYKGERYIGIMKGKRGGLSYRKSVRKLRNTRRKRRMHHKY